MTSLFRILCLSPAQLMPPYHLRHQDLEHAVVPIDLETDAVVVGSRDKHLEGAEGLEGLEGYMDTRQDGEEGIAYVRVMRNPVTEEYFTCLFYSPWPAYAPDPYHRLAFTAEEGHSLAESLCGTHRLFPYYTHDRTYPLAYQGTWLDLRLTEEAVEAVEQEARSQGIGARRGRARP